MPELPEVETIRRQLETEVKGYSIKNVKTDWQKSFRPSFKVVSRAVIGRKIEAVERKAKLLIFRLGSPGAKKEPFLSRTVLNKSSYLLFHLKLTGRLLVRRPGEPRDDYTHSVFTLVSPQGLALKSSRRGLREAKELLFRELRFADACKFGYVLLVAGRKEIEDLLKGYGPEPFKDLNLGNFRETLKSSTRSVKQLLLDQEKISGIGNIYANDALWLARLDPRMTSNKVTKPQAGRLYKAILVVLKRGLRYGGASDQWYRQIHGEMGQYQEHFLVYGRAGEKCLRCGSTVKRVVVGGRGTFICPACQFPSFAQRGQPAD